MPKLALTVLRLGHRKERDKRITTHCGLVARALLADSFVLCGEKDESVLESLRKVSGKWGGRFKVSYAASPQSFLKQKKRAQAVIVHLTFYGIPLEQAVPSIQKAARRKGRKELVVAIGAEKVPTFVYQLADFNVSVTSQPHSEVAALALFLDRFQGGAELAQKRQAKAFAGALVKIEPQEKGKRVLGKRR